MKARAALKSTRIVARSFAHDSADMHVQGTAPYVDDLHEPEGMLHVVPGYARDGARGEISFCDLSDVAAYPGVVAVLTAKDVPGNNDCSPSIGGDPILADGRIIFHGQVVFAVVGSTREAARRAARLAKIRIDVEKPVVSVGDAIDMKTKDVVDPYSFGRRDVSKALAGSANRVAEKFLVGGQEHFYLEGQVAAAYPEEG